LGVLLGKRKRRVNIGISGSWHALNRLKGACLYGSGDGRLPKEKRNKIICPFQDLKNPKKKYLDFFQKIKNYEKVFFFNIHPKKNMFFSSNIIYHPVLQGGR
jgi:hypothetical protein